MAKWEIIKKSIRRAARDIVYANDDYPDTTITSERRETMRSEGRWRTHTCYVIQDANGDKWTRNSLREAKKYVEEVLKGKTIAELEFADLVEEE